MARGLELRRSAGDRQTDRPPGSSTRCLCGTRGPTGTGRGSRGCRGAGAGAQSPRRRSPSLHTDGSTWESTRTAPDAGAADAAVRVLCQRRRWLRNAWPALAGMCSPQKCSSLFSAGSRKAPGTASGTRVAAPRNHGQTTRRAAAGEPATAPGRPKREKLSKSCCEARPGGVTQCHRNTQSKPPGRDQSMHTSNMFPRGSKNQFKLVFHSSFVKLIIRKQT